MSLTDPLFFDNDCLSAFLWVDFESILIKLYPGRILIPYQVYKELSDPGLNLVKRFKTQVNALVRSDQATIVSIIVGSPTYELYLELTQVHHPGHKCIDDGEAAAIALAKEQGGILASNNLKDVSNYVREFGLKHVTTGAIMKEAMVADFMTERQGNANWKIMLARQRKLGYESFSDYLKNNP